MSEVRLDDIHPLRYDVFDHGDLVIVVGVTFLEGDGILGAVADAGTETVAQGIVHNPRFSIDELDGAFGAIGYAQATPGTGFLVDLDDGSRHAFPPGPECTPVSASCP